MKQVFSTSKGISVLDVPAPLLDKDSILVETHYSFISSGTEMATLKEMEPKGLSDNIVKTKERLVKLIKFLNEKGIKKTISILSDRIKDDDLSSSRLVPIGYCCSGIVVAIGDGVSNFNVGDKVACAGAGKATHSELVVVGENLCVKIPNKCDMKSASSVAVGSIAMNGVRNSDARMGEFICVIGLGLVGLIVSKLLKISGCRVIGFDINSLRVKQAKDIGVDEAFSDYDEFISKTNLLTKNMGVDRTIITAASTSKSIIASSMDVTKKRGRVIAIGFIPMDIEKDPFMKKEIEFMGSSSYGPGRYDDRYEEKGFDYPYAYVRWTEKRNMDEYLRLISNKQIDLFKFIESKAYPVNSAQDVYKILREGNSDSVGFFINYLSESILEDKLKTKIKISDKINSNKINLAIVGAGSFVKEMYLPNIKKMKNIVNIRSIVNKRGHTGLRIAKQQGANYVSTSFEDAINDDKIDALIIATRHNTHSKLALKALKKGKHVLLEKPLAIKEEELKEIENYFNKGKANYPILLTGFNRRFSPHAIKIKDEISNRSNPLIINYQINTKPIDSNHWQKTDEGGGRNLGEACHIYDLFTFLTDAKIISIDAKAISIDNKNYSENENFISTLKFDDGSICSLTYTCVGTTKYPKETATIYCDGMVYHLRDYLTLDAFGIKNFSISLDKKDKGHYNELKLFFDSIKKLTILPIPISQQIQATKIALEVEKQIK